LLSFSTIKSHSYGIRVILHVKNTHGFTLSIDLGFESFPSQCLQIDTSCFVSMIVDTSLSKSLINQLSKCQSLNNNLDAIFVGIAHQNAFAIICVGS